MAPELFPASVPSREPSLAASARRVPGRRCPPCRGESRPRRADWSRRWLRLFIACRVGTALVAGGLLALRPFSDQDPALAVLASTWTAWSILAVRLSPGLAAPTTRVVPRRRRHARARPRGRRVAQSVLPAGGLLPDPARHDACRPAGARGGTAVRRRLLRDRAGDRHRVGDARLDRPAGELRDASDHPGAGGALAGLRLRAARGPRGGAATLRGARARGRTATDRLGAARLGQAAHPRRQPRADLARRR